MKRKTLFVLSVLFAAACFCQRSIVNVNADWHYLEVPYESQKEAFEAKAWQQVDLPHTWNSEDVMDLTPGYRRDASWYKKTLKVETIDANSEYFLYFEGVNISSEVYVNGKLAKKHVGGYIGFEVPITSFINQGSNVILVRVDNGYDPQVIPSQKSDFFIYGGITRDVWFKKVNKTHISNVKISTPNVSKKSAEALFNVALNQELPEGNYDLVFDIKDPRGLTIYNKSYKAKKDLNLTVKINKPRLWHVDNPNLYTLTLTLAQNGETVDVQTEKYGYRWFEFADYGPFYLNGKRLLLRGTHRHEEHAGYGAAMPNELHRRDIEQIKEMGGNFVRLGHYPQDPEVYKACDELGILVWDELPWCRGGVGDDAWKQNTKRMLKQIITQNYNHPSVIIWSLGNEIYWLPDFEDGGNTDKINRFLNELNELAHSLDPSRKTAIRKYYAGADIVDVFSPSIWSGWYSGVYKSYEKALESSLKKYPHFLHMEYGGSSHVGRHTEQPITGDGTINPDEWEEAINQVEVKNIAKSGDWSENYIVDLFDWHLRVSESHEKFAGSAQWAFKDFGTPLRPENDIPYVNQKGLVDREGNPKDAFYVFKSYWSNDPFIYIESHTWTERSGPEGKERNLSVYSNLKEVELFQDGQSLGKKKRNMKLFPACGLNWDIVFQEGDNELLAVGEDAMGNRVEDKLIVNYTFKQPEAPAKLSLSYEVLSNGNYLVSATARDQSGQRCLEYEDRVYFQCLSGGTLHKNQGTPTGSESIRMANGKASIEVIPSSYNGNTKVAVLNQDFKGTYIIIEEEPRQ